MLEQIFQCLKLDLKHESELIKLAKGKNKLPETIKETYNFIKLLKWHKR